jgi:hypothetical protein
MRRQARPSQGLLLRENRSPRIGPLLSLALVASTTPFDSRVLSSMLPLGRYCNCPRGTGQIPRRNCSVNSINRLISEDVRRKAGVPQVGISGDKQIPFPALRGLERQGGKQTSLSERARAATQLPGQRVVLLWRHPRPVRWGQMELSLRNPSRELRPRSKKRPGSQRR